jgi:hypothetical protein
MLKAWAQIEPSLYGWRGPTPSPSDAVCAPLSLTLGGTKERCCVDMQGSTPLNSKSLSDPSHRATMSFLFSFMVSLVFLLSADCTNTNKAAGTVDLRNPESVIRAYFDAWQRSDWSGQASLMDEKYAQMIHEPVDSIRLLEIQPISSSSSTERTYHVIFEIKVKGQGVSMQSGRVDWQYYLTWEAKRGSWLITNYGAG